MGGSLRRRTCTDVAKKRRTDEPESKARNARAAVIKGRGYKAKRGNDKIKTGKQPGEEGRGEWVGG